MIHPSLKRDPELLTIKTKDDEIKELKHRPEKHVYVWISTSMRTDNDCYKKKNISLNRKKLLLNITETLIGSSSRKTSTLTIINPSADLILSSSSALITSITNLITIEYLSKLNVLYTKLS